VSTPASQEAQPLDSQIKQAHEKLGGLEQSLRAIDAELEVLTSQSEQYALLGQACEALQKLDELGLAGMFWGKQAPGGLGDEHIDQVRKQVEDFHHLIAETEMRRQALIDELKVGQEVIDILEEDLYEKRELEEERKREWLIEREIDFSKLHRQVLPWMRGGEDDDRFRKTLAATLLVSLLIGLLLPMIDLPIPDREEVIEVPERLARLIREPLPLPPAEPEAVAPEEEQPPEPEPEAEPEPEVEPEPVLAEESEPIENPQPEDLPPPAVAQEPAPPEERVRSTGILAFRESFSNLATSRPSAQLGSEARINNSGEAAVGRTERSMVATDGPGSSGGINLASLSRDVGGGGGTGNDIAGVQVTRVASGIGGNGTSDRPLSGGSAAGGRTDEEIQIVFDRYKSALYRLYNRELRNDPTLQGQVVLRLTIEADGSVSFCEMQSSDMNAPVLEQQVVDRVKTFDFGAKEGIPAITIVYPIDFLPAA
jgi:TonB family protein